MFENIFLGLALVFFFEGAMYALFPEGMKRMMVSVLQMSSSSLRVGGLSAAVVGVFVIWLIKG
ncbi:MAG: DUF2065 domain-containing protein [Sneathiella sp.]|nr:DUF2065 domain-containing protein [Sneathiella sp.]